MDGGLEVSQLAAAQAIARMKHGPARDRQVWLFHKEHYALYRQVATRFRTRAGVPASELDDLTQMVAMVSDTILNDSELDRSHMSYYALLVTRTNAKLRDWSFSGEYTGIGGGSGARRRGMYVARVTLALRESLGREPTIDEIVTEANAEMARRRSNPTKSGKITERDVAGMNIIPSDLDLDVLGGFAGPVLPGDVALDPAELRPFAMQVVAVCTAQNPALGMLAEVYLTPYLQEDAGYEPTVKELSTRLARPPEWVRKGVHDIHRIAKKVLEDDLGIDGVRSTG